MLSEAGAVNAVSLRVADKPEYFSMKRGGTHENARAENRREFFRSLGVDEVSVARGEQVHGDQCKICRIARQLSGNRRRRYEK